MMSRSERCDLIDSLRPNGIRGEVRLWTYDELRCIQLFHQESTTRGYAILSTRVFIMFLHGFVRRFRTNPRLNLELSESYFSNVYTESLWVDTVGYGKEWS